MDPGSTIAQAATGLLKSPVAKVIFAVAAIGTGIAGIVMAYSSYHQSKLTKLDITLRTLEIEQLKNELNKAQ